MKPQHIHATEEDIVGNQGLGRYFLLAGSDERAFQISQHFRETAKLSHGRQHNLYLGTLPTLHGDIEVASISTGMGGPSADIILNELIQLGAKRLLRVGTAGSLQPQSIRVGDVVIATAAVRDDKASWDYIYPEFPAIASIEYLIAAARATRQASSSIKSHIGIVHSKSSLHAREMGFSFLAENTQYMEALKKSGVLASEMECAQFFTLAALMTAQLSTQPILSGAVLAIVGDDSPFSDNSEKIQMAIDTSIDISLETTKQLSYIDKNIVTLF